MECHNKIRRAKLTDGTNELNPIPVLVPFCSVRLHWQYTKECNQSIMHDGRCKISCHAMPCLICLDRRMDSTQEKWSASHKQNDPKVEGRTPSVDRFDSTRFDSTHQDLPKRCTTSLSETWLNIERVGKGLVLSSSRICRMTSDAEKDIVGTATSNKQQPVCRHVPGSRFSCTIIS